MRPRITASTRVAGVVGQPVRHSLSPVIHNAWIDRAGLDAVYLAFEPGRDRFASLVDGLRGGGVVQGLNVTLPFKEDALALADEASAAAARSGAANRLLFRPDGSVEADNSDGQGLLDALQSAGFEAPGRRIVVLGAGGASRGAVLALLDAGAAEIAVVNRSAERALAIAALDPRVSADGWGSLDRLLDGSDAVINATSLGMAGQPRLELSLDAAPKSAVVMDMIYRPLETELLATARRRGHPTADGLAMLIGQAAPSYQAFFNRPPPADVDVRALCEAALAVRP